MKQQFLLPDPGEGLTEAELVTWRVAVGDQVEVNDVLLEIETAKSLVELPSPFAGTVTALLVEEGATVAVGTPVVEVEDGQPDDAASPSLVGYGVREAPRGRRRRRPTPPEPPRVPSPPADEARAKPGVRKLARDLGVVLAEVAGTGIGGRITRSDVEAADPQGAPGPVPGGSADRGSSRAERRVPIRGVRRTTAANMVRSVNTHVHVTEWVTVDVTATMEFVERLKARREFSGLRVSPLLLHAKAVCLALRAHPELNSSWDEAAQEIVLHSGVNLGVAAATPRGLMVPNIKGADELDLLSLCRALNQLVAASREGKLQPADNAGGTFTLTNVGVFGVDSGTPVINGDESAILCMGAIQRRPWVVGAGDDERVVPRWVTTVSISFDHRHIDGEQGSRFLRDVADILTDPGQALLF